MTEANFWRSLRTRLGAYGMVERVENTANVGTPDLCYCLTGVTGWLELKYEKSIPSDHLFIRKLTREQVVWAENWHRADGRAGLLLRIERGINGMLAFNPAQTRYVYDRGIPLAVLKSLTPDHFSQSNAAPTLLSDIPPLVRWLTRSLK